MTSERESTINEPYQDFDTEDSCHTNKSYFSSINWSFVSGRFFSVFFAFGCMTSTAVAIMTNITPALAILSLCTLYVNYMITRYKIPEFFDMLLAGRLTPFYVSYNEDAIKEGRKKGVRSLTHYLPWYKQLFYAFILLPVLMAAICYAGLTFHEFVHPMFIANVNGLLSVLGFSIPALVFSGIGVFLAVTTFVALSAMMMKGISHIIGQRNIVSKVLKFFKEIWTIEVVEHEKPYIKTFYNALQYLGSFIKTISVFAILSLVGLGVFYTMVTGQEGLKELIEMYITTGHTETVELVTFIIGPVMSTLGMAGFYLSGASSLIVNKLNAIGDIVGMGIRSLLGISTKERTFSIPRRYESWYESANRKTQHFLSQLNYEDIKYSSIAAINAFNNAMLAAVSVTAKVGAWFASFAAAERFGEKEELGYRVGIPRDRAEPKHGLRKYSTGSGVLESSVRLKYSGSSMKSLKISIAGLHKEDSALRICGRKFNMFDSWLHSQAGKRHRRSALQTHHIRERLLASRIDNAAPPIWERRSTN